MTELDRYLKIMELNKDFTLEELNKKYKTLSKKFHPDRHTGNELQQLAEEKQKEINEAYSYLKDYIKSNSSANKTDNQSQTEFSNIDDCFISNEKAEVKYIQIIEGAILNYRKNFYDLSSQYFNKIENMSDENFVNEIMLTEENSYLQKFLLSIKEYSFKFFVENAPFFNYVKSSEKEFILRNNSGIKQTKANYIYEYAQFFLKYNNEFFCNILVFRYDIFYQKLKNLIDAAIDKYDLVRLNMTSAGVSFQASKQKIRRYFNEDFLNRLEKSLKLSIFIGFNSDEIEKIFERNDEKALHYFDPNYRLGQQQVTSNNLINLLNDFPDEKNNFLIEAYLNLIFEQDFEKAKEIYKSGYPEKNDYLKTIARKLFFSTDEEISSNKVIDKLNFIFLNDVRDSIKEKLEKKYEELENFDVYQYLEKNLEVNHKVELSNLIPNWYTKDYKNILFFITFIQESAKNSFEKSNLSSYIEYFNKMEEKFNKKFDSIENNVNVLKRLFRYLEISSKISDNFSEVFKHIPEFERVDSFSYHQIFNELSKLWRNSSVGFGVFEKFLYSDISDVSEINGFLEFRISNKENDDICSLINKKEEEIKRKDEDLIKNILKVINNEAFLKISKLLEDKINELNIKLKKAKFFKAIVEDKKYTSYILFIFVCMLLFSSLKIFSIFVLFITALKRFFIYTKLSTAVRDIENIIYEIKNTKERAENFYLECSNFIKNIKILYPEKELKFSPKNLIEENTIPKETIEKAKRHKTFNKKLIVLMFIGIIAVSGALFYYLKNKRMTFDVSNIPIKENSIPNNNISAQNDNSLSVKELKLSNYYDENIGFSLDYPIEILSISDNPDKEMLGTLFRNEDESIYMLIFRDTIEEENYYNLESHYLESKKAIKRENSENTITYEYLGKNSFIISYQFEDIISHLKVVYDEKDKEAIYLILNYDKKQAMLMQPIINKMLDSLKIYNRRYKENTVHSTLKTSYEDDFLSDKDSKNIPYETYYNGRFDFYVDYPTKYFQFLEDSANGDGKSMLLEGGGIYLSFSAMYNALFTSIEDEYNKKLEIIGEVEYKNLGKKSYTLSYYGEHGEIVFEKKIYDEVEDKYITLYFEYDEKYKDFMTPIINRMTNSVKPNSKS